jgi:imidazolonepropionase-like amidohydrolase
VQGPRIFVAAHIISASAGHGDLRGFYNPRWTLPVSTIADDPASVRALVRREHTYGSDWIKTTNTGGYFSAGDDPARVTWFDDEMEALTSTAHQLGMPTRFTPVRLKVASRRFVSARGVSSMRT